MLDLTFFEAKLEHQINRDGEKLRGSRTPSHGHALGSKASSLARALKGGKPEPLGNTERYPENQRLEQISPLQSRCFEDLIHPGSEKTDRTERGAGLWNMA
jgi:hypothetical protein